MFCPKCGTPSDDAATFCGNCGNPLSSEPVVFAAPKKGSHWPPVIIMAVMLCLGLACFFLFPKNRDSNVQQPSSAEGEYLHYSTGTVTFHAEYYDGGTSLTIPDTFDSMPVMRIGEEGFAGSYMLEEVILPRSLIEIDDSAFAECTALRGIYVPEAVFRIGSHAFADCVSLEAVYIHDSIQTIESDAFTGCDSLRHLFFDGTLAQWKTLFHGELPMSVTLYCSDGAYQQGPSFP